MSCEMALRDMGTEISLVGGVRWKLLVGEAHGANGYLVGADCRRSLESHGAASGRIVVLVHAVAGHAKPSNQLAVEIKGNAPRKEHDAVLVGVRRLRALRTRMGDVVGKQG